MSEPLKQCTKCKEWYPPTPEYFGTRSDRPSGITSQCRNCKRKASLSWNQNNRDRLRETDRDFRSRRVAENRQPETDTKVCSTCGDEKPVGEFKRNRRNADGLDYSCRSCTREYQRQYITRAWAKKLVLSARQSAAKRGHECTITEEDVLSLWEQQGGLCYWLGTEMLTDVPDRHPQKVSLERLDGDIGYVLGNVVLACQFANIGRNNVEENIFRRFVKMLLGSD